MARNDVVFKASADGLVIVLNNEDSYEKIFDQIERKLESASFFFKGHLFACRYRGRRLHKYEEELISQMMAEKTGAKIVIFEIDPAFEKEIALQPEIAGRDASISSGMTNIVGNRVGASGESVGGESGIRGGRSVGDGSGGESVIRGGGENGIRGGGESGIRGGRSLSDGSGGENGIRGGSGSGGRSSGNGSGGSGDGSESGEIGGRSGVNGSGGGRSGINGSGGGGSGSEGSEPGADGKEFSDLGAKDRRSIGNSGSSISEREGGYLRAARRYFFTDLNECMTKFHKGTLRSGKLISYDGNVVVIGDVNPGAEVEATGNIVIFGSLRGVAHAGASGNRNTSVVALNMAPTQLRIAEIVTRRPDGKDKRRSQLGYKPEIAYIKNDEIHIEAVLTKGK